MVVNNQEPESGGKEGLLAIVAIVVVLFFVIRIYTDYVTKTGQAVKPGHERHVYPPKSDYAEEGPLVGPDRTGSDYVDSTGGRAPRRQNTTRYPDEPTTERSRSYPQYPGDVTSNGSRYYPTGDPNEIVVGRARGSATPYPNDVATGRSRTYRSRYPGEITTDRSRSYDPGYPGEVSSGRSNSFGDPYPGEVAAGRAGSYSPRYPGGNGGGGSRFSGSNYPGEVSAGRAFSGSSLRYPESTVTRDFPGRWMPSDLSGQVVVGRESARSWDSNRTPEPTTDSSIGRRSSSGRPPRPRPIDGPGSQDSFGTPSFRVASVGGNSLFRAPNPYPGTYDDIQIGDRLSEISRLQLPGGHVSRTVYTYRPGGGPFKMIYATLEAGPGDPAVTGLVYMFRSSRDRDTVERKAREAFGDGDSNLAGARDRLVWPHLEGYTVAVEPDRYTVQEDLSPPGRRARRDG